MSLRQEWTTDRSRLGDLESNTEAEAIANSLC
jgi:hypothetical protein